MNQEKKHSFWKHNRIILSIFTVGLIIVVALYFFAISRNPDSVGQFEYIGKEDWGCYYIVICNNSDVYYATDLDENGIINDFQKYYVKTDKNDLYYGQGVSVLGFKYRGQAFSLNFYDSKASLNVGQSTKLRESRKKHIIKIYDDSQTHGQNIDNFLKMADEAKR